MESLSTENRAYPLPRGGQPRTRISLKDVHEPVRRADGYRVLVAATWPIGPFIGRMRVDEWARDLAPSRYLNLWALAHPDDGHAFRSRYLEELRQARRHIAVLRQRAATENVTLVADLATSERTYAPILAAVLAAG